MKISEIFYSIQGEGVSIGRPTAFVRTYGCNLRCSYCDTIYAREGGNFTDTTVEEVVEKVKEFPTRLCCVTGG